MSGAEALTCQVEESFAGTDPRLRLLTRALVRHLHGFATEVGLTREEWAVGIDVLTRAGQACTEVRQELILLSDVLGLSMLVEELEEGAADHGGTAATVTGPFHLTESPRRDLGDSIDETGTGTPLLVTGSLSDSSGAPVAGTLDVWQADGEGFYDVQVPDRRPPGNGRGLFTVCDDGRFWFQTVVPAPYPIPVDGPVGELLRATGRHPYRPAHIHFKVDARGHRRLTTHVFFAGSDYLDSDAVFAVRESLIVEQRVTRDPEALALLADRERVDGCVATCRVNLVLQRTARQPSGRP